LATMVRPQVRSASRIIAVVRRIEASQQYRQNPCDIKFRCPWPAPD
jgi:hypothetical protein